MFTKHDDISKFGTYISDKSTWILNSWRALISWDVNSKGPVLWITFSDKLVGGGSVWVWKEEFGCVEGPLFVARAVWAMGMEGQGELFIVCDLQSWVQLGTFSSKLLVHGTLQSRAVSLGSGAASSFSWKYAFQKSSEALLLRPSEDMCTSFSTCQGKGTVEISVVWLAGCPYCFYLAQQLPRIGCLGSACFTLFKT